MYTYTYIFIFWNTTHTYICMHIYDIFSQIPQFIFSIASFFCVQNIVDSHPLSLFAFRLVTFTFDFIFYNLCNN